MKKSIFKVLFIFCLFCMQKVSAQAQVQTNKTCRIYARLSTAFLKDVKINACRLGPTSCSEVISIAKDEFRLNPNWNGIKQSSYDGCNWILRGKELTYYVPIAKASAFINDLKSTGYFTNVQKL